MAASVQSPPIKGQIKFSAQEVTHGRTEKISPKKRITVRKFYPDIQTHCKNLIPKGELSSSSSVISSTSKHSGDSLTTVSIDEDTQPPVPRSYNSNPIYLSSYPTTHHPLDSASLNDENVESADNSSFRSERSSSTLQNISTPRENLHPQLNDSMINLYADNPNDNLWSKNSTVRQCLQW